MNSLHFAYANFGELLGRLRLGAGFIKQQELATALGRTQQSVSRWESGAARPRVSDIRALEKLLGAKDGELMIAAGYQTAPQEVSFETSTSLDRPLPLPALTPETFESFCASLLDGLYRTRDGKVCRYGGTGHKQHGIDLVATGPFGIHTFQCKRVSEFGAQKVHAAVAQQTFVSDHKVLLLSSVASPKARDAIALHSEWELWDREDITRKFHQLSAFDRLDLVDRYFNGQRLDLLGEREAGPIQTAEAFFKPFLVPGRFFNHSWELIGHGSEVEEVFDSLRDDSILVTGLVGAAGSGKSRILYEITQRLADETSFLIGCISPTEEIKAHHLENLRDSNGGKTILIIDDAHEREDLGTLLRHASVPENNTHLLLALRPYGREALRLQAADVSLSGPLVRFVDVQQQTREQARALAESILAACGAPPTSASDIAGATYTTPLATVLAAQLVARDKISLQLLGNAEDFRTHVLSRLQDVVALTLVGGQDVQRLRAVLRIIALLQPIIPDDPSFLNILAQVEGVGQADATRLIRLLSEAGVLFKRGARHRLAPDLLADEVIREHYLGANGEANQDVSKVFDLSCAHLLKNLFINLGRLDWRLREGRTDDSLLLNSLKTKLQWGTKYDNPHAEAVEAVAYYQPRLALDFAKRLIDEGHGNTAVVCNMIRNASYTYNHLSEACHLLWIAGRNDSRPINQDTSHGIRVLKELATVQLNKPLEYVQQVVRFALSLLERPMSLNFEHAPFSVLEGALGTEIETTNYAKATFTFTRYQLPLSQVQAIRDEITDALLSCLQERSSRKAFLAAQTLAQALRGPMHGDTSDQAWQKAHYKLLHELYLTLQEFYLDPVVLVQVAKSVAWHAFHGWKDTSSEANAILALLNRDLRTRLTRALVDGWGTDTWKLHSSLEREEHHCDKRLLAEELRATFSNSHDLLNELDECLLDISKVTRGAHGAPFLFINQLMDSQPELAGELVLRSLERRAGHLSPYVGHALSVILSNGDTSLINDYIASGENSSEALAKVAEAYGTFSTTRPYTLFEINLFKRIFSTTDPQVLFCASRLLRQLAGRSPALALELVCLVDFLVDARAVHDMFMWMADDKLIPAGEVNIRRPELLRKLVALDDLDDHWIREFLLSSMKQSPSSVVEMVKARIVEALRRNDWTYTPLQKDFNGKGLELSEIETGPYLLRDLLDWAQSNAFEGRSLQLVGEAISGLCGDFSEPVLETLLAWTSGGTSSHGTLAAFILAESQPTIIYEFPTLIRRFLDAAELISEPVMNNVRTSISMAALSGGRMGTPGEPFPEDIRLEKHCINMLATLSRVEPTFELYDGLLKYARHSIAHQRRADDLDEDD
ncbi:helix-turn-helix domain-containing protein [Caballeronia zhejiangensis]|nr:helix-turn-helix domain-containing protein [Caballeronia zhejiangensis]SAL80661.1 helix-turn-helix protein [Caballeronia peredens]